MADSSEIRAGDVVRHRPSGETWLVCGVDAAHDQLVPCGHPFPSIARLSDCDLLECEHGQTREMRKALHAHGLDAMIEPEEHPDEAMRTFVRERDAALLSFDDERVRAFCAKYHIPPVESYAAFRGGICKSVLQIKGAPEVCRQRARAELRSLGMRDDIDEAKRK